MNKIGIPNLDPSLEASWIADMKKVEELMREHIKGDYPLVVETSRHLVEAGGKRLRPLLTLLAAQFGDPTNYDIIKAAVCCELTHLATLYHDDVMDDAVLRRGVISANKKWNNAVAILTGDYLFSKVSDMLADRAIVLEVYAASEKPIAGVTSRLITDAMSHGEYIPNFIEVTDSVIDSAEPQDVIITLGAGDVSSLAPIIVDGLSRRFG